MNWQSLWLLFREKLIKFLIKKMGLAIASPWVQPVVLVLEALTDKFIKPVYRLTVAKVITGYRKRAEARKLKELGDAILHKDSDTAIDIIDSLK